MRLAQAHAQHGPPTAEMVQGDHLLGQDVRPPARQRCDTGAQPDPARADGHGGQQRPGIVHFELEGDDPSQMVPDEDAVPACLLGLHRQFDDGDRIRERRDVHRIAHAAQ